MIMRSYFEGLKASAQINFKPTCFEGWFEYTDLRRPFWIFSARSQTGYEGYQFEGTTASDGKHTI
jgi:hypothetical protein